MHFYSSTSASNREIKRKIAQEIKDTPGVEYGEEEIRGNHLFFIC